MDSNKIQKGISPIRNILREKKEWIGMGIALITVLIYFIKLELRVLNLENYEREINRQKEITISELNEKFKAHKSSGVFAGSTTPGTTNWQAATHEVYLNSKIQPLPCIYLDIDLSAHQFQKAPSVFWSLAGNKNHFEAKGVNSVYQLSQRGFRIYLHYRDGITPAQANSWGWHVKWIVIVE